MEPREACVRDEAFPSQEMAQIRCQRTQERFCRQQDLDEVLPPSDPHNGLHFRLIGCFGSGRRVRGNAVTSERAVRILMEAGVFSSN